FYTFGREHPFATKTDAYLDALLAEIESSPARLGWIATPYADTIYFGGGTPSLMGEQALKAILTALHGVISLQPRSEITLEVNPTTAEAAGLERLMALGINSLRSAER